MRPHRIFFLLLLIFLPSQLGFHFWPDWAVVLGRRVDYLSPTVYFTDILVLLTVGTYSISNFKFQISKKKLLFLLAAILFIVVNITVAVNRDVAVYKWAKVLEFGLLAWYIITTKPAFSFIIYHLSFGILYSSVLAIAQFLLQHSVGGPLWFFGERTFNTDTPGIARIPLHWSLGFGSWDFGLKLRPYATFPHPNVFGGFLAATLPILISNVKFSRRRQSGYGASATISNQKSKFQIFKLVTIVLGLIALFLTFSRSAIVIGVAAIVLVLWHKTKNQKLTCIIFSLVAFAFVLILNSQFSILNSREESVVVRQQLNVAAAAMWQHSPLLGVGLGNFLVKLPETLPSRSVYFLQPVHNIYLLLLSEVGIVGIGLIFLWTAFYLKQESRIMNQGKGPTKFIIHNSLFIILLLGLIDHYPLTLQQGQLLLTLFIALSVSPYGASKKGV